VRYGVVTRKYSQTPNLVTTICHPEFECAENALSIPFRCSVQDQSTLCRQRDHTGVKAFNPTRRAMGAEAVITRNNRCTVMEAGPHMAHRRSRPRQADTSTTLMAVKRPTRYGYPL
jgi:hypothetical protein